MSRETGQPNNELPESSDLATLELKANLNPEQRAHLEVLKAKMKKILGNKTKQELAKAGDLVALKNYKAILVEILEFLQTKNIKPENLKLVDDFELKRKQLAFIQNEIVKVRQISPQDEWAIKRQRALELQKNIVVQSRKMKVSVSPEAEVEIFAADILEETDIWSEYMKREDFPFERLYLDNKIIDEAGNLLYLKLGVAGQPEIELQYYLAGKYFINKNRRVNQPKTILGKSVNNEMILKGGSSAGIIATYNEEKHKWEP